MNTQPQTRPSPMTPNRVARLLRIGLTVLVVLWVFWLLQPAVITQEYPLKNALSLSADGQWFTAKSEEQDYKLAGENQIRGAVSLSIGHVTRSDVTQTLASWGIPDAALQTFPAWGVSVATFSPDQQLLATGAADQNIQIWQRSTRTLLQTFPYDHPRPIRGDSITDLAFSPDGHLLAASGGNTVELRQVSDGQLLHTLDAPDTFQVAFSPDGQLLACGGSRNPESESDITLWRVSDGRLIRRITIDPNSGQIPVAFSPDGQVLAAGVFKDEHHYVQLWRVEGTSTTPLRTFSSRKGIYAIAFSPDGQRVATGSADSPSGVLLHNLFGPVRQTVSIWHINTLLPGVTQAVDVGPDTVITALAFTPDGQRLVVSARTKIVTVRVLSWFAATAWLWLMLSGIVLGSTWIGTWLWRVR